MPPDDSRPAGRAAASAPPRRVPPWLGWLVAAVCAIAAGRLAQLHLQTRHALVTAHEAAALERVDAQSARNSLEAERLIAQGQLAELRRLQERFAQRERPADLAELRIVTLTARSEDAPQATGTVVWSTANQEGVLVAALLPPLSPGKAYRLWIVDAQYPDPVDAGEFLADPKTGGARYVFKTAQPIHAPGKFVVSLEARGAPAKPAGPALLAAP